MAAILPATEGYVDDTAALSLAHRRKDRLDASQSAEEIRLHASLEFRERKLLDRVVNSYARVVDQNVDALACLEHFANGAQDGLVPIHVHGKYGEREFLFRRDRLELGGAVGLAHGRKDVVTGAGELYRRGEADPRARSRDDCSSHY